MRKPLGFYNYELLSGIDKKLFESLAEDEACLRKGTPVFKIRGNCLAYAA